MVGHDGHQFGVVRMAEAMRIAEESGMDLVEVSPNSKPPVVKVIDYGKYKYEAQKRANEAKKKQVIVQLKEFQFRPNIEKHDLDIKLKKIEKIITQGDKVRLIMQFRGREIAYKDAGLAKFNGIVEEIMEFGGVLESGPKFMGSRIIAIMTPGRKK